MSCEESVQRPVIHSLVGVGGVVKRNPARRRRRCYSGSSHFGENNNNKTKERGKEKTICAVFYFFVTFGPWLRGRKSIPPFGCWRPFLTAEKKRDFLLNFSAQRCRHRHTRPSQVQYLRPTTHLQAQSSSSSARNNRTARTRPASRVFDCKKSKKSVRVGVDLNHIPIGAPFLLLTWQSVTGDHQGGITCCNDGGRNEPLRVDCVTRASSLAIRFVFLVVTFPSPFR